MPTWLVQALWALAFAVAGYLLTPKPKPEGPAELEAPEPKSGEPVAVVFGTRSIGNLNILWFGEKSMRTYKVKT